MLFVHYEALWNNLTFGETEITGESSFQSVEKLECWNFHHCSLELQPSLSIDSHLTVKYNFFLPASLPNAPTMSATNSVAQLAYCILLLKFIC